MSLQSGRDRNLVFHHVATHITHPRGSVKCTYGSGLFNVLPCGGTKVTALEATYSHTRAGHPGSTKRDTHIPTSRQRVPHGERGKQTLKQAFSRLPGSAICVQNFDDSLNSAIRITYRISLRSSSLREPRYPLLKVVLLFW